MVNIMRIVRRLKMVARANVNGKEMFYVGWVGEKEYERETISEEELTKEDLKEELYN